MSLLSFLSMDLVELNHTKKYKSVGEKGRKMLQGGFSDFSYQICIIKCVIFQLVANQAA